MNWYLRCAYEPEQKRRFHTTARARLRKLAAALDFAPDSFDLRSNEGGIAVSGEITMHHDRVYVQVSQSATGYDSGILIRTSRDAATTRAGAITSRRCRCLTTFRRWRAGAGGHRRRRRKPHAA